VIAVDVMLVVAYLASSRESHGRCVVQCMPRAHWLDA
jgi:hypothetical protein